jgi:hypothetical protein
MANNSHGLEIAAMPKRVEWNYKFSTSRNGMIWLVYFEIQLKKS